MISSSMTSVEMPLIPPPSNMSVNRAILSVERCLPRERSRKAEGGGEPLVVEAIVTTASREERWGMDNYTASGDGKSNRMFNLIETQSFSR